ncbi:MAG TPA: PAS domain S-box protein, partial [Smithellaceae bacterium]|nr:PAS domain S-box protein [Smithellaceae bacterium]
MGKKDETKAQLIEKLARQKKINFLYRGLADNLRDMVIATDIQGNIIYANKAACESSGYNKEEALQINVLDIIPAEYHAAVGERIARRQAGNKDIEPYEIEIISKSGRKIFLEVSSTLISDGDAAQGILLFSRNITQRKKMEEALRAGEKKFRAFAELLPTCAFECDANFNITFFSNNALETFGYTKEDIEAGFNILNLVAPDNIDYVLKRYTELINSSLHEPTEFNALRKDGSRLLVQLWASKIIENNSFAGLRGFVIDITENRKMEAAIKAGEKKFREFAELLPGSAFECDLNFNVTFFNNKALKTYGYTKEDFAAGFNILRTIAPEEVETVLRYVVAMMEGSLKHPVEATAVRKDGTRFPIHISASLIMDEGKPVGVRGQAIDITEFKEKERALRQSEARYRAILDTLEDGYYEVDLKGHMTNFNDASLRLLGWERDELLG